jgi:hypothetical protein
METKIVHIPMQRRRISRRQAEMLPVGALEEMRAEEAARAERDARRCYWLNMLAALEGRLVPGYDLHGKRIAAEAIDADALAEANDAADAADAEAEAIERAAEQAAEQAAEDNLGGFTD